MTSLLDIIEAHLEASGMSATAFGLAAMGNPKFVFDLRDGRGYTNRTEKRVRGFIAQAKEKGAA